MKKSKNLSTFAYLFGVVIIIIISCRKEILTSSFSDQNSKLAIWYEKNHNMAHDNPFGKLEPQFDRATISEDPANKIYEIPVNNPERMTIISDGTQMSDLDKVQQNHMIRLLIFENKISGKILYGAYMSVENTSPIREDKIRYKKVGNLTGTVMFYHLSGKMANGWFYENGKIKKQLTVASKESIEAAKSAANGKSMEYQCVSSSTPIYTWACVGSDEHVYCNWHFNRWENVTSCRFIENEGMEGELDHDYPGGGGGDYIPTVQFDCAGIANGDAYIDTECMRCVGGLTGIACGDIDTSALDTFRCAKKLIKLMPTINSDISKLIDSAFGKNHRVNLKIVPDYSLVGDTVLDGRTSNQYATFALNGKTYYSFTVEINPDILSYGTNEYVLVTIYHEALHAYLKWQYAELGPSAFALQFEGLNVNGGRLLGYIDPQHVPMGYTKFVNGLKNAIMAYNPGFDASRAYAMAVTGIGQVTAAQSTMNKQERNTRKTGYTGTKCP
ncbi:MAG: hypothetical protein AAGB30_11110 [Pedobacter sp.]|nr:hypothetical protein [Cellulomonas sp.]